jgi:predicted transcriptional regulator
MPCGILRRMGKLRDFRHTVGQTSHQVAKKVGINQSTLVRLELGQTDPKLSTALRLVAWADDEAKRQRVPRARRLDLGDLVPQRARP